MKYPSLKTVVASSLALLFSVGAGAAVADGAQVSRALAQSKASVASLSSAEAAGLVFMREEEKLARDVYLDLYRQWKSRVFSSIAKSEQQHFDTMGKLISDYGLDDPAVDTENGEFEDEALQSLYDALMEKGSLSLVDALLVGATIEEVDLIDIAERLDQVSGNADIVRAYENLMRGSRNHLRAFVRNLRAQGVEYAPAYLDQETYNSVIESGTETGRRR